MDSQNVKIVKVSDLSKKDIEKLKTYPGTDQKAMLIRDGKTSWDFVNFTGSGWITNDYTTIISKEEMWPVLFAKEEKPAGTTKDDNNKSERPELIEAEFIKSLARVMAMGAKKYSANQWKQGGEGFDERLYGAALRHLLAWRSGEKIDPESGESHLSHVTANMMMLHWYDNKLDTPT